MDTVEKTKKKNIITIAGRPGSGKSTTAKLVALELGYNHFSSGDLFRALGKERGVDVLEANRTGGVTEELDNLVDGKLREIGENEDKMVIDSRTAWHWIPNSYKVFLELDMVVAAQRILEEISHDRLSTENIHQNSEVYAKLLIKRLDVETKRYKKIYGINPYDMNNYDLVIDTSKNHIDEVVMRVVSGYKDWKTVS
jgi:CMP/dCMP kinase